ncbi:lactoylglutathione lyase [Elusimicrobium posterum]|uniref:VOC family protein n=1 Tax=Elusimicrobium posterum TaxID=3116653 RepID=UPI003C72FAF4
MKISHIALYTNRLEEMREFYLRYFQASSGPLYHNTKTGLKTYFIIFDEGTKLEIMQRPETKETEKEILATGYTHLAVSTGSKEKVDELTTLLRREGFKVISGPRTTGDGYYESVTLDPDGNQIEITE